MASTEPCHRPYCRAMVEPMPRRWARLPAGTAQARSTVRGVLALQMLANGIGILVIALYLRVLFPRGSEDLSGEVNLVVFGGYLLANLLLALPLNLLLLRRAVVWVRESTPPTARQRWLVLRLPFLETISAFVSWCGGALLFAVLNTNSQRAAVGITIAGVVTCTGLYLLLEGHFRPVFALALQDGDLPEGRRDVLPRLMLAWILGSGVPFLAVGLAPQIDPHFNTAKLPWFAAFGIFGGCLVMAGAAISVARPLNRLRRALRDIEQGNLDLHVPVDDLGELGRLAEGINDLVSGLREREQLREEFSRQVGHSALADAAADGDSGYESGGELRDVTVLFVDLQGYTRYSEQHTPEEVVTMLNRFFRVVVAVVNREGGWVNKFEGDAALCVFGAPNDSPDHAADALRAAEGIRRELARVEDVLPTGIGVAGGTAIAGFIGTPERFEDTVIGDCVNLAARLCQIAKDERSGALASEATIIEADRPEPWTDAGRVRVRGRSQRVRVFTLPAPRWKR